MVYSNFPTSILEPPPPPPPPPAGWYSVNVRVRYLGVPLILRFLFPRNSLCSKTIVRSRTGVGVEASLVLTWTFLQTNEHSKPSSADNSLILCAIAGNSTLLSLDEKPWTSDMLWPKAHMSDGLLRLMDSWFDPWWLGGACSVNTK